MIRHPVDQCPAEFVSVFQEILENSDWESENPSYICHSLDRLYYNGCITSAQCYAIVEWVSKCLQGRYSFGGWLWDAYPDHAHLMEKNQCRKAWLEWLISPEGHY